MPTGYTCGIKDGISFKEFILGCARGFGACVMQRDDDPKDPPKMDVPDEFYLNKYKESVEELTRLKKMTGKQKQKYCEDIINERISDRKKWIVDKLKLKKQYENMLAQVNEWTPPSDDHIQLKDFMIEQIKESIKWDCDTSYNLQDLKEAQGTDWIEEYNELIVSLHRDIERYLEDWNKEVERTTGRNKWKQQLFESLE